MWRARSMTGMATVATKSSWRRMAFSFSWTGELAGNWGGSPIPAQSSDCLVFANLSGKPRATDVLVKTRYSQIWAYDNEGHQLWSVQQPGGFRTAHQPCPIDLDGDGTHEIVAGYSLLNADGSVRWTYASGTVDLSRDTSTPFACFSSAPTRPTTRLVLTCCGANNLAMVDGTGRVVWELAGHHFESLRIADLLPDVPGKEILVDIDHLPKGESLLWVVSAQGRTSDANPLRVLPAPSGSRLEWRRVQRDRHCSVTRFVRRPRGTDRDVRHGARDDSR